MDKISPEFLRVLDVVGLSRCVDIGGGAAGLDDRGGGPSISKGEPEGVFQLIDGSHSSASLQRSIQGRRVRRIVEPQSQEEQCGFLSRMWSSGQPLHPRQRPRGCVGVCPVHM